MAKEKNLLADISALAMLTTRFYGSNNKMQQESYIGYQVK